MDQDRTPFIPVDGPRGRQPPQPVDLRVVVVAALILIAGAIALFIIIALVASAPTTPPTPLTPPTGNATATWVRVSGSGPSVDQILACHDLSLNQSLPGGKFVNNIVYSPGAEIETDLAVDPNDPTVLLATAFPSTALNRREDEGCATCPDYSLGLDAGVEVWRSADSGETWDQAHVGLGRCSSRASPVGSVGHTKLAADPILSFDERGQVYFSGYALESVALEPGPSHASYAKSVDGGLTWGPVRSANRHESVTESGLTTSIHDGGMIRPDPTLHETVYYTWGEDTPSDPGTLRYMFARTDDGGETWDDATLIVPEVLDFSFPILTDTWYFQPVPFVPRAPGADRAIYIASVKNVWEINVVTSEIVATMATVVLRSDDEGLTFGVVNETDPEPWTLLIDPTESLWFRAGLTIDFAQNPENDDLYTVMPTSKFSPAPGNIFTPGQVQSPSIARSTDLGATWTDSVAVSPNAAAGNISAFLPTVAVNSDGLVGVFYYENTYDRPNDTTFDTDIWFTLFSADLTQRLALLRINPTTFDSYQFIPVGRRRTGFESVFIGDYGGVVAMGRSFAGTFIVPHLLYNTTDRGQTPTTVDGFVRDVENRQDIWFSRVDLPALAALAPMAAASESWTVPDALPPTAYDGSPLFSDESGAREWLLHWKIDEMA